MSRSNASSGNNITIDLTNSNFSSLSNPGDFINLTSVGVLLLKISSSEFRAFDNCCPIVDQGMIGHIQTKSSHADLMETSLE